MKTLREKEWFFSQEKEAFDPKPPMIYAPDPHYNIYRLKTTRQLISEVDLDLGLGLDTPFTIGAVADLHFNVCNQKDRQDEELSYTEQCRFWPENLKWAPPAIRVLDACDFCDAAVIIGDMLDYLTDASLNFAVKNVFKKYPEYMVAIGAHDFTKQVQTQKPELTSLEERLNTLRAVWPHDIHYYSRDYLDKITVVILDNSQSKYLNCEVEPFKADIERARREGRVILVFQHEPMISNNPAETSVDAIIGNTGTRQNVDIGINPTIVGGALRNEEATPEMYELITKNSDVVKAVFAGHWHSQFYSEIVSSYEKDGEIIKTLTPQYVISGNPYHEAGAMAKIIIK